MRDFSQTKFRKHEQFESLFLLYVVELFKIGQFLFLAKYFGPNLAGPYLASSQKFGQYIL